MLFHRLCRDRPECPQSDMQRNEGQANALALQLLQVGFGKMKPCRGRGRRASCLAYTV